MIRASRDIASGETIRVDPNLEDFHERFIRTNSISPFDACESLTAAIHSISVSVDLFGFADDILEQAALKKKIKKTGLGSAESVSLDSFKLFGDRLDQNILAHLRLVLVNSEDIKANRDIASFVFDDFKQPISTSNEAKCKQALRQVIEQQLGLNRDLSSRLDPSIVRVLEKNGQLVEYLERFGSRVECDELERILGAHPVSEYERIVLRNFYVSLVDNHLLENNLKYLSE